ncbi:MULTISPECIES: hypothetical protein [Kamptonema]|uniref:hypothetical protein n=1 Tax=Kamptonema TaxID=1501433 RepID=UPI0011D23910|nr:MULTISPECIES: hypothetical protein [Kamptonema]
MTTLIVFFEIAITWVILGNCVGWRSIVGLTAFALFAMTFSVHTLPPVFLPCCAIAMFVP